MGVGGQRHVPATLHPIKNRYPSYRRLGGPQSRSGRVRKISPPPGFEPRTAQSVASRCTDCATRPTLFMWGTNCVFVCDAFTGTFAVKAIRLFNRLFGVILSRRGGFDPWPVRVGFAVNKQVFIGILRLCPVRVFIPVLHTRPNLLAAHTRRTRGENSKP